MSLADVCPTVPQISTMHRVASDKIDPSSMVCFRPFVALCQYYSTPSWPHPFRLTKISRKSKFFHHFFPKLAPKKIVTAHLSPDYYVALILFARPIIFDQKRRNTILLYIIKELDDHILLH